MAGVSTGSLVAQVFAGEYSGRATRLVLRDTFSKVHGVEARIAAATATTMLTAVSVSLQIRLVGSYYDTEDEPVRESFRTRSLETDRTPLVQAHRAVERFVGRTTPDRTGHPRWFSSATRSPTGSFEHSVITWIRGQTRNPGAVVRSSRPHSSREPPSKRLHPRRGPARSPTLESHEQTVCRSLSSRSCATLRSNVISEVVEGTKRRE